MSTDTQDEGTPPWNEEGAAHHNPIKDTARLRREARQIPLDLLEPGDALRAEESDLELEQLAASLRQRGLLQPLVVRPLDHEGDDQYDTRYRVIAGHRRLAALRLLDSGGLLGSEGSEEFRSVPCIVIYGLSAAEELELTFTENTQRLQLAPLESAHALKRLLDENPGMSARELADSIGLRPSWVRSHFLLLELPASVLELVEEGALTFTAADLLRRGASTGQLDTAGVEGLARKVARGDLSTQELRGELRKNRDTKNRATPADPTVAPLNPNQLPLDSEDVATHSPGGASADDDMRTSLELDERGERERAELERLMREEPTAPTATPSGAEGAWAFTGDEVADAWGDASSSTRSEATTERSADHSDALAIHPRTSRQLESFLLGLLLEERASDRLLEELGVARPYLYAYAYQLDALQRQQAIQALASLLLAERLETLGIAPVDIFPDGQIPDRIDFPERNP